jgi:hypothetical protein
MRCADFDPGAFDADTVMDAESLWHDLLEAEHALRQAAEDLARRWREAFFAVAAVVSAADYDARMRAGTLPTDPEDAARWLMSAAQSGWRGAAGDDRLRQELARLRRENARLAMELERLKTEPLKPRPEQAEPAARPAPPPKPAGPRPKVAVPPSVPAVPPPPPPPQGTAAAERAAEPPPEEAEEDRLRANEPGPLPHPAAAGETHPAPPPDVSEIRQFLESLRGAKKIPPEFPPESFLRDALLVATIGYTGISSRPRLAKALAAALGISSKSGSLTRAFERCGRLGLVNVHKEDGAPFSLLSLSERGREAFRKLFGYEPVPSEAERFLAAHPGNVIHAVYCAWAREFAEAAGYEVIIPDRSVAPGPVPDLILRHGNEALGVEVERALGRTRDKWQSIARVRGVVAVIAPDHDTAERIAAELDSIGARYLVTDFSYLVAGQPQTPDAFWRKKKIA